MIKSLWDFQFDFRFYKFISPAALGFQNSFSIRNCAFIVFAISTVIMYLMKQTVLT